jgi:hypothetical protein
MFWLSLPLGAVFLVMMHHLFDAAWSVPVRRFCEHLACLVFPWMGALFIPIALLAPRIYAWISVDPRSDHALRAKWPLPTLPAFYGTAVVCFAVWWVLAWRLRSWSLKQDRDGSALPVGCSNAVRRSRLQPQPGAASKRVSFPLSVAGRWLHRFHGWHTGESVSARPPPLSASSAQRPQKERGAGPLSCRGARQRPTA